MRFSFICMCIKCVHAYYSRMSMIFKRSIREGNTCTTCLQLMAAFTVAESKLKIDLRTRFMKIQGKRLQLYWSEVTFRKVMALPQYLHLCILQKEWFVLQPSTNNHLLSATVVQHRVASLSILAQPMALSLNKWSWVYKKVTRAWPVGEWASKQSSSVVSALVFSGTEWKL